MECKSFFYATVKPVLSRHRIERTPSIKRTVAEVPKFVSLIYFNPFAPEPPVTARADPGPFYPL